MPDAYLIYDSIRFVPNLNNRDFADELIWMFKGQMLRSWLTGEFSTYLMELTWKTGR